jgi:N-carbamoyl-L-amino-acid hydrolase
VNHATLQALNAASAEGFAALLDGVYEHSPWIAARAAAQRPFASCAQLLHALAGVVRAAGRQAQLALLCAHPELAARVALTPASAQEQGRAGLAQCSAEEFAQLRQLNAAYRERFGWPFIVAVRGPRGDGLARSEIIASLQRRLGHGAEFEFGECLRQVHRIAQIRLHERLQIEPQLGAQVWDWAQALAAHSESPFADRGELCVSYLSGAHRACAQQIAHWMQACGFDEVAHDALGNVVGVYHGSTVEAPRLLTGSHFDTVRNAGRYDGRLGILAPLAAVQALHAQDRRLRHGIELVAFAEEEGQRYATSFLGSSALAGRFDPAWLDLRDAQGVAMREAMRGAGLPASMGVIAALRRDPARYLGFVEIHIEQGPVLDALDLPLGVVSAINGARRFAGEYIGRASHAGTTPMDQRHDAAAAAAELVLAAEACAARRPPMVATVGMLEVPAGSVNVVPGRCRFSLDLRAPSDALRDEGAAELLAQAQEIAQRRGVALQIEETMRAAAAPCDPAWSARWAAAVQALGLPLHRMPSGAGHDAMMLHHILPQAMLFVRGGNAGISHNPLETITAEDADLCVQAFLHLCEAL